MLTFLDRLFAFFKGNIFSVLFNFHENLINVFVFPHFFDQFFPLLNLLHLNFLLLYYNLLLSLLSFLLFFHRLYIVEKIFLRFFYGSFHFILTIFVPAAFDVQNFGLIKLFEWARIYILLKFFNRVYITIRMNYFLSFISPPSSLYFPGTWMYQYFLFYILKIHVLLFFLSSLLILFYLWYQIHINCLILFQKLKCWSY